MEREQEEMQFLGIFGIYRESYKIIFTWRKLFSQITLALILPLSFIFLAHIQVSDLIFDNITHEESQLDQAPVGSAKSQKLNDLISSEWTYFIIFELTYFTFFLIFSLLSTAAVVYTIACIYTAKRDITFRKVMSVVPKVWKRLMVTFLFMFAAIFTYNVLAVVLLIIMVILLITTDVGVVPFYAFLVLYYVGLVYLTIIWQLGSVVSVLEDACGIKAMMKSRSLIKGKIWTASIIFFLLNLSLAVIQVGFERLVVDESSLGMMGRVVFGIVCFLLLFKLFLFGLVIQTVIYFVCKSYHHENIDKSALADHLEVYLGDYVPLKAKDVQLQQFEV